MKMRYHTYGLCEFCSMKTETLTFFGNVFMHMFFGQTFPYSYRNIMYSSNSFTKILCWVLRKKYNRNSNKNFIILLGKDFIFKTKHLKQHPTSISFRTNLCQRSQREKQICFIKDRLAQFNSEWGNLRVLIEN